MQAKIDKYGKGCEDGERAVTIKHIPLKLVSAAKKDAQFLLDLDQLKTGEHQFQLWWLGQSGFLLQWKEQRILIDPYLSDSLTKKYADTSKPHVRVSERVVDPDLLREITIVSSSHNHTDHLDAETLIPLLRNNPGISFIIPEANRNFVAERVQCKPGFPIGLNDGGSVKVGDFTYWGIPAKHNEIERDERGNCKCMGFVIAFGKWKIYHSGDSLLFDQMVDLLRPFKIDLALLPINGNDPARGVAGNFDSKEAAALGKAINARCVIPCHYDMFAFNTADPSEFAKQAKLISQPFKILRMGESWNSDLI